MHTWREVVASSRRGVRVPYVGWIAFDRLQKTIESDPDRLWGIFMTKQFVAPFVLSISLLGCGGQGLSPAQLTGDQQSDLAVREYLLASYQLAHQFGFDFRYVENTALRSKSRNINTDLFGFQLRSDVPYSMRLIPNENLAPMPITPANRTAATIYYIKTGTYASLILCRNYLSGLRDRNEYFEFLQKELNVAGGLATIAMQLASANGTIRTSRKVSLR